METVAVTVVPSADRTAETDSDGVPVPAAPTGTKEPQNRTAAAAITAAENRKNFDPLFMRFYVLSPFISPVGGDSGPPAIPAGEKLSISANIAYIMKYVHAIYKNTAVKI